MTVIPGEDELYEADGQAITPSGERTRLSPETVRHHPRGAYAGQAGRDRRPEVPQGRAVAALRPRRPRRLGARADRRGAGLAVRAQRRVRPDDGRDLANARPRDVAER